MTRSRSGTERTRIAGLGPHGERAVPVELIALSEADAAAACSRQFTVAVVLHTTQSDWSRQQLAGIVSTLGRFSAAVVEVVDCRFQVDRQVEALERIARERPDAVISIPIGNTKVADAHRRIAAAGIRLVLIDNVPTGLLPGADYASLVSADNFGLGEVCAELLSRHVPPGGTVGMLTYAVDFFVTNERAIAFRKWMVGHRRDVVLRQAKFADLAHAAGVADEFVTVNPELAGLFVAWDEPAMEVVSVLRARALDIPITTIDLGNEAAIELAANGLIKGIGAQQPYDQGAAAATATLLSLLGHQPPPWVALPGLAVTAQNVLESYQVAWHAPAPPELLRARRP